VKAAETEAEMGVCIRGGGSRGRTSAAEVEAAEAVEAKAVEVKVVDVEAAEVAEAEGCIRGGSMHWKRRNASEEHGGGWG
jgi:hypothetical protein